MIGKSCGHLAGPTLGLGQPSTSRSRSPRWSATLIAQSEPWRVRVPASGPEHSVLRTFRSRAYGSLLPFSVESLWFITTLYALAVLIPGLAVSARRLHDTNRSGWWILTGLVPILGWIALLIFYVEDSRPGANQYGPNPKGV